MYNMNRSQDESDDFEGGVGANGNGVFVIPFEVRAYGVLFSVSHSLHMKDYNELNYHSHTMIEAIGDHTILSVRLQEFMHKNKDSVTDLVERLKGCRRLVAGILEEDDTLLFLNLQVLQRDPSIYRYHNNVEYCLVSLIYVIASLSLSSLPASEASDVLYSRYSDIESLLESIELDFRSAENQAEMLLKKLNNTEQSVRACIVYFVVVHNIVIFMILSPAAGQSAVGHFAQRAAVCHHSAVRLCKLHRVWQLHCRSEQLTFCHTLFPGMTVSLTPSSYRHIRDESGQRVAVPARQGHLLGRLRIVFLPVHFLRGGDPLWLLLLPHSAEPRPHEAGAVHPQGEYGHGCSGRRGPQGVDR